jgi:hypothetical protein
MQQFIKREGMCFLLKVVCIVIQVQGQHTGSLKQEYGTGSAYRQPERAIWYRVSTVWKRNILQGQHTGSLKQQ